MRSYIVSTVRMSVIITGDRCWLCDELAKRIVGRLVARYSKENLVIFHGTAIDAWSRQIEHPIGD